jgi:hypothetical protein
MPLPLRTDIQEELLLFPATAEVLRFFNLQLAPPARLLAALVPTVDKFDLRLESQSFRCAARPCDSYGRRVHLPLSGPPGAPALLLDGKARKQASLAEPYGGARELMFELTVRHSHDADEFEALVARCTAKGHYLVTQAARESRFLLFPAPCGTRFLVLSERDGTERKLLQRKQEMPPPPAAELRTLGDVGKAWAFRD